MTEACVLCRPDPHTLQETASFRVVADHHPLAEGHTLIVPREHIACVGVFPMQLLDEFVSLYHTCLERLQQCYGSQIAVFEHGVFGQTVAHSHVHLLPFTDDTKALALHGESLLPLEGFGDLLGYHKEQGGYFLLGTPSQLCVLQTTERRQALLRHRFAHALDCPERADWRVMHDDADLMESAAGEIEHLETKWKR